VGNENVYFGLGRVAYSKERLLVQPGAQGLSLPPGCSVVYRLECLAESVLEISGQATGAGRLELGMRLVDPIRDDVREGTARTENFTAENGPLEARLPLPPGNDVVEIDLTWFSSDPSSVLELRRLGLKELPQARRPPVLFVSIDTLSAQHLSLYGYERKTSPNLEAFAKDCVRFANCRSNAPWTIPSYMSQFTGLYPRAHVIKATLGEGRLDPTPWETQQMAPSRWTLAEFFRAAGYRTAAFVDNPWLTRGFGFRQGFGEFDGAAADIPLMDPSGGIRHIVPRALDWLDARAKDEPFFLFVQAFDPHAPYPAAAPWNERFAGDGKIDPDWEIPVGRQQAFAYGCVPGHIAFELCEERPLPERLAVAPIATAYDQKIAEVDEALATLIAGLKERGLYDQLLIVFSADHGESTINHDFFFNHALLYEDVLHVPLLIKLPGQERAGTVVDSLVTLVDLYPTLVEFVRPGAVRGVHGSSLLPLMRGAEQPPRIAFAEGEMMEQFSVEKDGWKLIVSKPLYGGNQTQLTHPRLDRKALGAISPELATGFFGNSEIAAIFEQNPKARRFVKDSLAGPFYELYFLPDDPGELHDLSKKHPGRVEELLAHITRFRELGERAKSAARFVAPPVELGSDDLEEMRALGYVGD
jgi:arylsulfatase A-like enzyme